MPDISVHDLLTGYRMAYESLKSMPGAADRTKTMQAYEHLLNVEARTGDVQEAQLIMEREHLVIHTITADYENIAGDFMEAVDPNYEVTSASVKATIAAYAEASSVEDITYMSELARSVTDDIAVQLKIKMEMLTDLSGLIFGWEHSKRKIREGEDPGKHVRAMCADRQKMREYYRFMSEDMGITWDDIESTPFYRIQMLQPQGLDALWRIKKIMHPDNIKAMRYVLFEEMLSDKSLKDILMTAQPVPYYENIDTGRYPSADAEYRRLADDLNKDIPYFRECGGVTSPDELLDRVSSLRKGLGMAASGQTAGMPGTAGMNPAGAAGSLEGADRLVRGLFGK